MQLLASSFLCIFQHVTAWIPPGEFSWNTCFGLILIFSTHSNFGKIRKKTPETHEGGVLCGVRSKAEETVERQTLRLTDCRCWKHQFSVSQLTISIIIYCKSAPNIWRSLTVYLKIFCFSRMYSQNYNQGRKTERKHWKFYALLTFLDFFQRP
jgi:hypothetical protein